MQEINSQMLHNQNISVKVIGVGGCGGNAIHLLQEHKIPHFQYYIANTDSQALNNNACENKLLLDCDNKGWGTGNNPEIGKQAALANTEAIQQALSGADVVIIASGLGGGTGTGATPVIAEIAKNLGALVICVLTTPFSYEGHRTHQIAKDGLVNIIPQTDSYFLVSNSKMEELYAEMPISELYTLSNLTLKNLLQTINDIIFEVGIINIDFADIKTVLKDAKLSFIGVAKATGSQRTEKVLKKIFEHNLVDYQIKSAQKIILNIDADCKTTISELKQIHHSLLEYLQISSDDIEIISGFSQNLTSNESIKISMIISGITTKNNETTIQTQLMSAPDMIDESVSQSQILQDTNLENTNSTTSDNLDEDEFDPAMFNLENIRKNIDFNETRELNLYTTTKEVAIKTNDSDFAADSDDHYVNWFSKF
ncbi:cell division protein FtsZ [Mycoplasmopsis mustelae]|uniref:Cell division protein FtsZ n=1 Tax=Mycoplasmopsis mustelae TaxID=171289 RepID=A0A4R7UDW7_9BACT|nr:cell division protein FtsZ [Mycoplasmopsis mustelae]TDV24111.1 cell division protein FtsZ [Mycoplasmopsis mustelae]